MDWLAQTLQDTLPPTSKHTLQLQRCEITPAIESPVVGEESENFD